MPIIRLNQQQSSLAAKMCRLSRSSQWICNRNTIISTEILNVSDSKINATNMKYSFCPAVSIL